MPARSPRTRALLSLFAAHRDLTLVEWAELRNNLRAAAVWGAFAALAGLTAWFGINAGVVIFLHDRPMVAVGAVVGFNFLVALVGALRVRSLLKRPMFALTRTEATRDVRALLETVL